MGRLVVTGQLPFSPRRFYVCQAGKWVRARIKLFCRWMGGGLGDRPASPLPPLFWLLAKLAELWPTEACLPVRARGGKFPEEISDEGAPQGNSCAAGPDEGGARRAGADTYNPSGQQPKRRRQNRARAGEALRSRHWTPQPAAPADALFSF